MNLSERRSLEDSLNEDVRLESERQATAAPPHPGRVFEVLRSLRIDGIEHDPVVRALAESYLEHAISHTDLIGRSSSTSAISARRSYGIASSRLPVAHFSAPSPLASIQP